MVNQTMSLLLTVGQFVEGVDTSILEVVSKLEVFIKKQPKHQKLITDHLSAVDSK